jgi:xanthine dehydrogenase YagT iron-sulfur-binding subunit
MPDQIDSAPSDAPLREDEAEISEEERDLLEGLPQYAESRRRFLGQASITGAGLIASQYWLGGVAFGEADDGAAAVLDASPDANAFTINLRINGVKRSVEIEPRVTLLDALRERLGLTGAKKGCDHGQCGACTALLDGRRVLSCLTLAAQCDGREVTTIEGLARGDELSPMQAAFIKHDGFQCGYCTPGQICSAVALMEEARNGEASYVTENLRADARDLKLSDDEIRERMSGNVCRCGAYPNIIAAIREVHSGGRLNQQASEKGGRR